MEKLNNPLVLANTTASVAEKTLPFILKGLFVLGIGLYIFSSYKNRFVKLKENSNYNPSNVTLAQAKTRADAIGSSIGLFSNSFESVADNLAGLNYNGFVRVYNAFGHQSGTLLSGDLNLIEWIKNQFSEYEIAQLSSLQNGVFFKIAATPKMYALTNFLNQLDEQEATDFVQLLQS